jgi:hypothetical protein
MPKPANRTIRVRRRDADHGEEGVEGLSPWGATPACCKAVEMPQRPLTRNQHTQVKRVSGCMSSMAAGLMQNFGSPADGVARSCRRTSREGPRQR